jgi:hypothetical protein
MSSGFGATGRTRQVLDEDLRENHDRLVAYQLDEALAPGATSTWRWESGLTVTILARAGELVIRTGELEQRVPIEWERILRSHRRRPWFHCPACERRCGKLYHRSAWACSTCHGLRHGSRHLNRWMTYHSVGRMLDMVERRSRSL